MTYFPELPIRAINEPGTPSEQYKKWANDKPCRSTEIRPEIEHFKLAKGKPMALDDFDNDGTEKSIWWRQFLIEMGQINPHDVHHA